jgi:hypothetical protein
MTNFLFILSLILNIVALFCIVILYLRQNRLFQFEKKQKQVIDEMENAVSTFLIEMREENDKFIEKVRELKGKSPADGLNETNKTVQGKASFLNSGKEVNRRESMQMNVDMEKPPVRQGSVYQAVKAYKSTNKLHAEVISKKGSLPAASVEEPPAKSPDSLHMNEQSQEPNDLYMKSLINQALLLKRQGLSTEDIAKKLNKGKTEIELLLKFRQNG